jgi:hypothetical protein
VKISKLTNGLLVSLLLSASVVEADSDYPATDFQPTVVFSDSDYKHTGSVASSSAKAPAGEVSSADPAYPAANFQPEVLFEDKGYKHTKGNEGKSIRTEFVKKYAEEQMEENAPATSESSDDSSMSLIMGLAVLAIAGFVFYSKNAIKLPAGKKKSVSKKAPIRRATTVNSVGDGSTSGVAKYLESKVGTKPSGVAKYLEDRDSSPVSGVAKYVAKKKVSARLASVTGVEKYLKDRG